MPRSFVGSAIIESKLSDVRPPNLHLAGCPAFGKNIALRAKKQFFVIRITFILTVFIVNCQLVLSFFRFVEPVFFPLLLLSDGTSPWMFWLLCESSLSGTVRRNRQERPTASAAAAGFLLFFSSLFIFIVLRRSALYVLNLWRIYLWALLPRSWVCDKSRVRNPHFNSAVSA